MVKYLIFGDGYIGNKFKSYFGDDAVISKRRIKSATDIGTEILVHDPEVVINCMGRTGAPNVDWCEDHKIETAVGNIAVPLMVAEACAEFNRYMVHIGSGCIYEGDNDGKGWSEEDKHNFGGSFYSRTKAISEEILNEFPILQLRIRIPLDDMPNKKNVINKLNKYERIIDVENSITYIPDLMTISEKLMEKRKTGIYNVVNKGSVKHSFIMEKYKEFVDEKKNYKIMTLDELDKETKATRSNCVLSVDKLESEGIEVRPIEDVVEYAMKQYKMNTERWNVEGLKSVE